MVNNVSLLGECHNISNVYNIAGIDFYNDDIIPLDFSNETVTNKNSNCTYEILNNGKALKQRCLLPENASDNYQFGGIMLDALIDADSINEGDILQIVGLAKTSLEHSTMVNFYVAEVRDGTWNGTTRLSSTITTSREYNRVHSFVKLGGRKDAENYKVSLQVLLSKNGSGAIPETEVEMILKNFKYSIIRKNWV